MKQKGMPWHVDDRVSRQNWATPKPLFVELERRFAREGFTLDVAAEPWNTMCSRFFTEEEDGLTQSWSQPNGLPGRVWVNPPYNDIGSWVRKSLVEIQRAAVDVVVLLLPTRRDQLWFHAFVKPYARVEDIVGRVNFVHPPGVEVASNGGAFEASMVVIYEQPIVAAEYRADVRSQQRGPEQQKFEEVNRT